ncbi:hypothetical protein [Marinobacterium sedimentorum]|uniref:hypothetical protein n=1 Tax=Marinobacterium sedimentorum TaxID=2927804 RepID=UPI0020C739BB|nr:hypothetical protein [Marinobacterium sedimentorum]MCP8687141.1 hypothetical protein [Marinobacterium sedimentorum]
MRLYDRITGADLNTLPNVVYSGRFQLRQKAALNRHKQLEVDELLCSDGAGRCQLASAIAPFATVDVALEDDFAFFTEAITTIARLVTAGEEQPSPLLPTAMISEQSHLSTLERLLEEVLSAGHLHSISKRPRIDLRYEQSVTEVSRARRLTNRTYTHLASHSECWQRQTLSGVQPRRVLARFSEDDYTIYENLVYARLLDELDKHLTFRLRRLDALCEGLTKALQFSESTGLHYLLIRDICQLWGSTYSPEQTKQQLETTEQTRDVVGAQLQTIRGLKQSGLYLQVPRALRVGPALHRTNILTHDQHYRHLALLWDELHMSRQQVKRTPTELLEMNQQLEHDYSLYIGLVLRYALHRYDVQQNHRSDWAGHRLSVCQLGLNWHLKVDETVVLELVPWACPYVLPEDTEQAQFPRVICWPGIEQGDCLDHAMTRLALRQSPMDLYVVERMGYVVDRVLNQVLLSEYATPLQPLPTQVSRGAEGIEGLNVNVEGRRLQVVAPLSDADACKVKALFEQHTRPELVKAFGLHLQLVQALSECPVCGSSANLTPQGDGEFTSHCQSCDTKRYWRKAETGLWKYQQTLRDVKAFRINGRRSMELSVRRDA